MTTPQIFKRLTMYLPDIDVDLLKLVYSLSPSVQMCLAVSDITKSYHGRQEDEDEICDLLANLCKNHFNKRK